MDPRWAAFLADVEVDALYTFGVIEDVDMQLGRDLPTNESFSIISPDPFRIQVYSTIKSVLVFRRRGGRFQSSL